MIGELNSVSTSINSDRILRENPVQGGTKQNTAEESTEQSFSDVTSFSPQALALSRKITPPGASTEQEQTQPQGRGQGGVTSASARLLDILV